MESRGRGSSDGADQSRPDVGDVNRLGLDTPASWGRTRKALGVQVGLRRTRLLVDQLLAHRFDVSVQKVMLARKTSAGTMPSSTAARVACRAFSTHAFSFISNSVAAPIVITATGRHGSGEFAELVGDGSHGLVDASLQIHRIETRSGAHQGRRIGISYATGAIVPAGIVAGPEDFLPVPTFSAAGSPPIPRLQFSPLRASARPTRTYSSIFRLRSVTTSRMAPR